ncbi:O-methylsterigmatocystin oxidoreductase [Mycena venus]|uniref:O-methylsterigmatocystin oxidoreductase n=1 Tax=Mycena venus TaxID=2733690 RepID=A0A8H6X8F2_9AGAR|nr:O-methylsterigmatocystin oxidoreductase [Mycena venus]
MSIAIFCFNAFTAVLLLRMFLRKRHRASLLPPGPPIVPLIGPVMYLEVLGWSMVILDSYEIAIDLLEQRGSIYSDRPRFTLYELLGWTPCLTFLKYGTKQFNKHRQMHQSYLNRTKAEEFKPIQTQEARTLVENLITSSPESYEKFLSRFATGIITQIVAGHRIASDDDPYLRISKLIYETMAKTGPPGGTSLDLFPLRARLAGVARACRHLVRDMHDYPLRMVKMQQEAGQAMPSFLLEQLQLMPKGADDDDVKGAAATIFGAGEATTWSTICIFVLAMILHPECQAKAQKEIDSIIGDQRLPTFEDREELPYVEGILQETLRWKPAVALGVPHVVMQDDIYRGMLIPKGSLVFANVKAMGLDERVYSDPTTFHPERYLPKPAGKAEPYFNDVAFGFGRRICTGRYVAENSLWIAMASILASCKITNMTDETGKIIVPETTMTDGLASHPNDIRCVICPRSPSAMALILQAAV